MGWSDKANELSTLRYESSPRQVQRVVRIYQASDVTLSEKQGDSQGNDEPLKLFKSKSS